MPIIAKGKEFELCPVGLHQATVREITQITHKDWGERVKFTFETDKLGREGQPLSVFHEASLSLSPKAKLTGILESILGRSITPSERKNGFDLENLRGMSCLVNVKHRVSQTGNEYAFVDAVIGNGARQQQSAAAVAAEVANNQSAQDVKPQADDEVPF